MEHNLEQKRSHSAKPGNNASPMEEIHNQGSPASDDLNKNQTRHPVPFRCR